VSAAKQIHSLSGDGVEATSDSAALLKFAPVVRKIGVNFPDSEEAV